MELAIHLHNNELKYIQIYEQIKRRIVLKQLIEGEKLPSKRNLSETLSVSVHTVMEAYEQLVSEGYIISIERKGYFVAPFQFDAIEQRQKIHTKEESTTNYIYNFHNGHVDQEAFPYSKWQKAEKDSFRKDLILNGDERGEFVLRQQIAQYAGRARGIDCTADQVFIFSGTAQQLAFTCELLTIQRAAIENPCYVQARKVVERYALEIEYIGLDEQGVQLPQTDAKLLYTTPAHQFPLGTVMTLERRNALIKWANEYNAYIFEDDYDGEYRYEGHPIPSLVELDQLNRVIYSSSLSKILLPSLRMSYVILPADLVQPMKALLEDHRATAPRVEQCTIAKFIETGEFDKHVGRMRTLYRKKQHTLVQYLRNYLPNDYMIIGERAGLHVILQLPTYVDEHDFLKQCEKSGVKLYATARSYADGQSTGHVMIGFGGLTTEQLREGARLICEVATYFQLNAEE